MWCAILRSGGLAAFLSIAMWGVGSLAGAEERRLAAPDLAAIDVGERFLDKIPAGTEIGEKPPRGWTLVAMHHPPYSAGYHGSSMDVRDAWSPLFAAADVPLALAGHDHDYQRSEPQDGVTYVVSGAGAKLRKTGTEGFTEVSTSTLHLLDLLVYDDRLVGRAIDESGRLVDHFTLTR